MRLPSYYIPHGAGPCFFMEWEPEDEWDQMARMLTHLLDDLPSRPQAVLLVSAHWLAPRFLTGAATHPELIFDYGGFPPSTYELRYDAPGDPALAEHAAGLLRDAGLAAGTDPARGFDHGVFVPLKLVLPEADVPVVPLSLRQDLSAAAHLAAGRALAPLRDEDVLIIGSGMSFHNMRGYNDPRFTAVSDRFDTWLGETVELPEAAREAALLAWEKAPAARLCHPPRQEEHLLPLLVAAGAANGDAGRTIYRDRVMQTTISAHRFG